MNLSQIEPRVLTTTRRTSAGLILAAVLLGTSLTACGSSPGDTTCGEYKDMSDSERLDLLKDEVDDKGTDEEKDAFDSASDEVKKAATDSVVAACDGEDDDTKLDDVS